MRNSTPHIRNVLGFFGRMKFGLRVMYAIALNRSLVICIGEGEIYARTAVYQLKVWSNLLNEVYEDHVMQAMSSSIAEVVEDTRNMLRNIPDERRN